METTVGELDEQGTYDLRVRLRDVTEPATENRAYELSLEDIAGTRFQLIVWDSATAADGYEWQPGAWYHLRGVTANVWPTGTVPHGTSSLTIEQISPPQPDTATTILYLTDSHLGKQRHEWLGNSWPVTPQDGFAAAIEVAIDEDVAAVVHGGDLFHNPGDGIGNDEITHARSGLRRLADAGIPCYFIYGNHEAQAGRRVFQRFVDDNLATHLGPRYEVIDHAVSLYGVDHHRNYEGFVFDLEAPPRDLPTILFMHQSMAPFTYSASPETSLQAVGRSSAITPELVVTGHVHTRTEATRQGYRGLAGGATTRVGETQTALSPSVELLTIDNDEVSITRRLL